MSNPAVRLALVHRCRVLRAVPSQVEGYDSAEWVEVAWNLPCLLDAEDRTGEVEKFRATANRHGVLTLLPGADVQVGDHVELLRGPSGLFHVSDAPAERWSFYGLSHLEFAVSQVASRV